MLPPLLFVVLINKVQYFLGALEAVHVRHLQVHQNQLVHSLFALVGVAFDLFHYAPLAEGTLVALLDVL